MQYDRMGVYEQTEEYHNKKPIWSRHDVTQKMFYTNGKFPFTEMTGNINNDMTGGRWMIRSEPAEILGGVASVVSNTTLLPHQISEWKYAIGDGKWQIDPLLTVTGNIIILRSLW